ncbi:hypothetical protein EV175_007308, partial [Coemansia sp. RSA 1933]
MSRITTTDVIALGNGIIINHYLDEIAQKISKLDINDDVKEKVDKVINDAKFAVDFTDPKKKKGKKPKKEGESKRKIAPKDTCTANKADGSPCRSFISDKTNRLCHSHAPKDKDKTKSK